MFNLQFLSLLLFFPYNFFFFLSQLICISYSLDFADCIIMYSSYVHLPWVVPAHQQLDCRLDQTYSSPWRLFKWWLEDHRRCIMCPCFSLPDLSSWCYLIPIFLFTEGCKIVVLYFYHIFFTYWLQYQSLIYHLDRQQYKFLQERQHLFLISTIYLPVFKIKN